MPRTNRPLTILSLACCCLCLYSGCIALPIPQSHRNIELEGKKIEETKLNFVVPGQTTKAEFIEKVGQPYLMMDDWGVMAYFWKMLGAYALWAAPGAGGIARVEPNYILLVSYDDQGVINKYETVRYTFDFFQKTVNERALQWAGKGGSLGKFNSVSPPAGKSVVYVFRSFNPEGSHVDHIDGVFLDGHLWSELKSGQYTPIVVSSGCHTIGFERDIRKTDKFLHPDRPKTEPALTTTIDTLPNQTYFLEIYFVGIDTKPTAIFSRLSEGVALPKLAGLKRAR
jgi:hypothetical protein